MQVWKMGTAVILAGAVAASAAAAATGGYPNRPIRYIVPAAAGSGPDAVSRLIAGELARDLGQQIVVDNRPGASGMIGMALTARAAPDGYTIGHANILNVAIVRSIMPNLPYDPRRDLRMVAQINTAVVILASSRTLPVKTVPELIEHARRHPGKLLYAYTVTGGTSQLGMELFQTMTGTSMVGVSYKSPPQGVAELIAGQTQVMLENIATMLPQVKAGRVHGLAVTSLGRSPAAPDLPSVSESIPGFELIPWAGIAVPAGAPDAVVRRLNAAINRALSIPVFKEHFLATGLVPVGGTPEQFASLVEKEATKWAEVIKRSGIRVQ